MSMLKSICGKQSRLIVLGAFIISLGGCIPGGLGGDLVASTAAAVVSDVVFTILDFFLLSPNVSVEEVRQLDVDFANSDHNPVFLKVKLK